MADLTPAALRIARRQHGNITTTQLTRSGVSERTRVRLERAGVFERDFKAVYRLGSSRRSLQQRCAEICLAHPGVFITGATAGSLEGLRKMPRHAPLTISSRHPLHVEHRGVLLRRSTNVTVADVTLRRDAIAIASPPRLAFDLAATLDARSHRSIVEQLLHDGKVTVDELAALAARLAHPTRPGSQRFLDTLATRSGKALESDPEILVAEALRRRGVPVEAQTTWLDLPNGRRARLDLSVESIKWGVEIDVYPTHLGIEGTTDDKQRDRQSHLLGWQIERVTTLDLLSLETTADELAELYEQRVAAFRSHPSSNDGPPALSGVSPAENAPETPDADETPDSGRAGGGANSGRAGGGATGQMVGTSMCRPKTPAIVPIISPRVA